MRSDVETADTDQVLMGIKKPKLRKQLYGFDVSDDDHIIDEEDEELSF